MPGAPPLLLDPLQCGEQVLSFPNLLPQLCVGLSFVSCRGRLGPLVSPRKLHFPPLSSSTLIQGILPSLLIPRTAQSTHPFLMFSPSHLDGDGTMASADSCRLSLTSQPGLPFPAWRQVSPGKNADFPCTLAPFTALALGRIGLRCFLPTRPASQPLMGFVFLKSQVCLRLPPDPASR